MKGVFRYGQAIAASLAIAALGYSGRYLEHWIFRDVENLRPVTAGILIDDGAFGSTSDSPMRTAIAPELARWKIAVVTNRAQHGRDTGESLVATKTRRQPTSATQSLADQLADTVYATAQTTFAFANVDVPFARERGSCPLSRDVSNRIVVHHCQSEPEEVFLNSVQQTLENCKAKSVLVIVHGFNVSPDDAIARAAQVAEDMPFHGMVITFSWRSHGETQAYRHDETSAERHFWSLAQLLADLRRDNAPDCQIHLLAHSMGNRVALRALNSLAGTLGPTGTAVDPFLRHRLSRPQPSRQSGVMDGSDRIPERFPDWGSWQPSMVSGAPPLASLILAAPDVDVAEFTGFVTNVRHMSRNIVLYASDSDLALDASRKLHGGFRAGDSRARLNIDGVRVVRVSGVSTLDPLGHSYYGSNPQVLDQLKWLTQAPIDMASNVVGARPLDPLEGTKISVDTAARRGSDSFFR
ncbi:MAG: alpha/beta fold hydrolase [Planctomycetaceae bacterium]